MRRGRRGTSSTSRQVRATVIGRSTSSTSHLPDGVPGSSRLTQTFNLSQIRERENSVPELNARLLRDLTSAQRAQYDVLVEDQWVPQDTQSIVNDSWSDENMDDERFSMSKILDVDACTGCFCAPPVRSWQTCAEQETADWAAQLPLLVEVFRRWKYGQTSPTHLPTDAASGDHSDEIHIVDVMCIDLTSQSRRSFNAHKTEQFVNETLLRNGYIATSPVTPSLAISIECLAFCHVA